MKKLIAILLLLGSVLATGLWWAVRRKPIPIQQEQQQEEEAQTDFHTETAGSGVMIRHTPPTTPVRALRWLHPLPGGIMIVQVVRQNDRQQIAIFKNGVFQATYQIPKPVGVKDGFFRFAELKDAQVLENDVAVLFFVSSQSSSSELPMTLALDLTTSEVRWYHRARGERLALSPEGKDRAIYLFGPKDPIVRLPIARAEGEQISRTGARSIAKVIELPPEIQEVSDLLAISNWTFLVVHAGGLSANQGTKGWVHHPMPEGDRTLFKESKPVLVGGKKSWWQPYPGVVLQIRADGTASSVWTSEELSTAEPFSRDASLLHLLGSDSEGQLWFDLSAPSPSPLPAITENQPPPTPEEEESKSSTDSNSSQQSPPSETETFDWTTYVNQGLDRVYRWDPVKKSLQRFAWSKVAAPPDFPKLADTVKLRPAAGFLLLENGTSAWYLPFSALPFGEPSKSGKPSQPK